MNPIALFEAWYAEELGLTQVSIPSACCLSTTGLDGYPNARFVSLKEILDDRFIITGPLASRKGREIAQSDKVALTFWWTQTERQIRIQGEASLISDELADKYFAERPRDAQLVSLTSNQGRELDSPRRLNQKYEETKNLLGGQTIKRPEDWGGYAIRPVRMEFLAFQSTRFHERTLFEWIDGKWITKQLQP